MRQTDFVKARRCARVTCGGFCMFCEICTARREERVMHVNTAKARWCQVHQGSAGFFVRGTCGNMAKVSSASGFCRVHVEQPVGLGGEHESRPTDQGGCVIARAMRPMEEPKTGGNKYRVKTLKRMCARWRTED